MNLNDNMYNAMDFQCSLIMSVYDVNISWCRPVPQNEYDSIGTRSSCFHINLSELADNKREQNAKLTVLLGNTVRS